MRMTIAVTDGRDAVSAVVAAAIVVLFSQIVVVRKVPRHLFRTERCFVQASGYGLAARINIFTSTVSRARNKGRVS